MPFFWVFSSIFPSCIRIRIPNVQKENRMQIHADYNDKTQKKIFLKIRCKDDFKMSSSFLKKWRIGTFSAASPDAPAYPP